MEYNMHVSSSESYNSHTNTEIDKFSPSKSLHIEVVKSDELGKFETLSPVSSIDVMQQSSSRRHAISQHTHESVCNCDFRIRSESDLNRSPKNPIILN
jgi:hypothetical protein